jgi:PAS domain S-box-containing protein
MMARPINHPPEAAASRPLYSIGATLPFFLLSLGLFGLMRPRKSVFDVASWLGLAVGSFALHVLLTYGLVLSPENNAQMEPTSAVAFLLLGCGLALARLDPVLILICRRDSPIGTIARRLLAAGLLLPPLVFTLEAWWLAHRGEQMHAQSVFFAAVYAMAFLGLIIGLLRRMATLETDRDEAEAARNELLARVQQQAATLQFEVSERTYELQESSKRLELALRSSSCGVWDWDPATDRVIWNERQCEIYGLTPEQFDGLLETWVGMIHPDDREQAESAMRRELKLSEDFDGAFRILTPSGAVRYIEAHGFAYYDATGKCVRVVGVDRDVTRLRESERALISLAERLQFALGSAGYGVWERDIRTNRLTWDDRMLQIYGVPSDAFGGTADDHWNAVHADDLASCRLVSQGVVAGRTDNYLDHFRIVRRDGSVRNIEARGFLQRSASGEPLRIVGLSRDVTAETELREQLRIAEERWQLALAGNNDGLWDWNVLTNEFYFDDRWAEMIGYGPGELPCSYSAWEERVHPEDLPEAEAALQAHLNGQTPFYLSEHRLRHKLGQWVWILDRGKIVSRDGRGAPVRLVGTHTDISEGKAIEKRLRHFEGMALQMGRLAQIGPWDWQLGTHKLTWSPEVYRIHNAELGFEPTFDRMLEFYEPESRAELKEAVDRAIGLGTPFDLELAMAAGGRRQWVRFLGKAESKGGTITHLYGAVQNITEIRESEIARRHLETQLFQAQKMETLGTLAGGIAHDFNNLLTGILGYQELALELLDPVNAARPLLDSARGVTIRARDLVEQILTLSRKPSDEMSTVDLSSAIAEAQGFLHTTLPSNVAIEVEIAPNCGRVLAEASQIHQVLLNLGKNAAHAIGAAGGTIQISLAPVTLDPQQAASLGLIVAGAYIRLSMRDSGHGMDAETQKRIFDPFFTTKRVGEGTGLGLSVVHGIVRAHRGAITVQSAPNRGATFSIFLRCFEGFVEAPAEDEAKVIRGSGELVCIVDDEEFVLSCVRQTMERLGYRTAAYDSGEHCLSALREDHAECALLITDQTMPGMTGTEIAEQARTFAPALPIIIMSGYFSKISPAILDRMEGVSLISKPFTSSELATAVHEALTPKSKASLSA